MKFLSLATLFSLSCCFCQAQDSTTLNYTRKSVWRALFLTPGVTNEVRLGPKTTLASTAQIAGYWGGQSSVNGPNTTQLDSYYGIYASLAVAGRYFYNFERRLERGKSIRYNSGNYLSVKAAYITPTFISKAPVRPTEVTLISDGPSLQALWGFQRTYRRNFYLNLGLGLGLSRQTTGFAGDFALGYTFPSTK